MRRVRPGTVSRGGTGGARGARSAASRAVGEERALTSVATGDRYETPEDLPRLWHVTLSVSGEEAP